MLVEGMSFEEMYKEVAADFGCIMRWSAYQNKVLRRKSLKARHFPLAVRFAYRSPHKNEWTAIFVIKKKMRQTSDAYIVVYTSLRTRLRGIRYYIQSQPYDGSSPMMRIYLPHFFDRYGERMQLDMSHEELVAHYFQHNDLGDAVANPSGEHEMCLCTDEGIAMGEMLNDRMMLCKTFIRYDMSLGWQRKAFAKRQQEKWYAQGLVIPVNDDNLTAKGIKESYKQRGRNSHKIF